MAKKSSQKTLVNFILDKSGSMTSVREATISGFNEYLGTLKKDAKSKYEFTLTLFDTNITRPFVGKDIADIKELDDSKYNPDGNTALYDAVCSTIRTVKEDKGQKVVAIIMTDGEENASKEYTEVQMKELIKEREAKGNWSFVYLGANQDSYKKAQQFGISKMNATNFRASDGGVISAFATVASNTSGFARGSSMSTAAFFSATDQANLDSVTPPINSQVPDDQTKISQHFSNLGKKSWDKRKEDLLK